MPKAHRRRRRRFRGAKNLRCPTRKRRYFTELKALQELVRIQQRHPGQGEVRAYPCRLCRAWHLTSKAKG